MVRERTKDTWGLWRRSVLNPESNVQFGEGGAGTFSDGKLYSQIKDPRHLGRKVLTEFVKAGAPEEILTEAHPHIGTFRLVTMVESHARRPSKRWAANIASRARSRTCCWTTTARCAACELESGEEIAADHVVLALGHSARDTFQMLLRPRRRHRGQAFLHRLSHRASARPDRQGALRRAASRSWARPTTSWCITPRTAAASTASACAPAARWWRRHREPGRVVTNGMSQYSRNERNANAGIVVGITPEADYPGHPLAGIALQRQWESAAFVAGGGTYARAGAAGGRFPRRPSRPPRWAR